MSSARQVSMPPKTGPDFNLRPWSNLGLKEEGHYGQEAAHQSADRQQPSPAEGAGQGDAPPIGGALAPQSKPVTGCWSYPEGRGWTAPFWAHQAFVESCPRHRTPHLQDSFHNARTCCVASFIFLIGRSCRSVMAALSAVFGCASICSRISGANRTRHRICVTLARLTTSRLASAACLAT